MVVELPALQKWALVETELEWIGLYQEASFKVLQSDLPTSLYYDFCHQCFFRVIHTLV